MLKDKLLALAVVLLGISILVSGFQISSAITSSADMILQSQQIDDSNDDILSQEEAAAYLKIPEWKLGELVEYSKYGNGIPHYKIGETIYFSKASLDKWIAHSAEFNSEY